MSLTDFSNILSSSSYPEDDSEQYIFENLWQHFVDEAIVNLRYHHSLLQYSLSPKIYQPHELFTNDGCRFTIKKKMLSVFDVYPWILYEKALSNNLFRESLACKKGESIEAVVQANNDLRATPLRPEEYDSLRQYYMSMKSLPQRTLWSIVEMKLSFDNICQLQKIEASKILVERLARLEMKVNVLLKLLPSQNNNIEDSSGSDSEFDIPSKRIFESIDDNDTKPNLSSGVQFQKKGRTTGYCSEFKQHEKHSHSRSFECNTTLEETSLFRQEGAVNDEAFHDLSLEWDQLFDIDLQNFQW